MRVIESLAVILTCTFVSAASYSQDTTPVDEPTILQHIDHRVDPVYPPIAKAAQVTGTVALEVRIGITGTVESVKIESGPPMLQQAAMDCVKQWKFKPFVKNGSPAEATGTVSINFDLGTDSPTPQEDEVASRYFPLGEQCRKAIAARTDASAAEAICKQAAETAEQFPPNVRFIEKRSAFVYAATACANNRDLQSALEWADKAVDVDKLGHDDNSGENAVYSTKGTIEGMMGNLTASDSDLSLAEEFSRKGIAWAEKEAPSVRQEYIRVFVRDLQFHAKVLQALDRSEDAQKKLDEAEKLSSSN
jgi:TonB family protein